MYIGSNKKYLKPYRQNLRNNPSMAEDLLWGFIRKDRLGVKFRRQHSIYNYILDFYCPNLKLNIEVDGEQHDGSIEKDLARDRDLNLKGIIVLRFASLECLANIEGIVYEIQENIRVLQEPPPGLPLATKGEGDIY